MKLRLCLLLLLCVVGIAGQATNSNSTAPAVPKAPITTTVAAAPAAQAGAASDIPTSDNPTSAAGTTTTTTTTTTTPPPTTTTAAATSPPTSAPASATPPPTSAPSSVVPPSSAPSSVVPPSSTPASGAPTSGTPAGTTTAGPTTTAAPPTTTTPAPPPTTPEPSPEPPFPPHALETVDFRLIDDNNQLCAKLTGEITFRLNYKQEDITELQPTTVNVPASATLGNVSSCMKNESINLALTWGDGDYNATFTFEVVNDTAADTYGLTTIKLDYLLTSVNFNNLDIDLNNTKQYVQGKDTDDFSKLKISQSYRCDAKQSFLLTPVMAEAGRANATVEFQKLKFVAYYFDYAHDTSDFPTAYECDADFTTSDIVPIAVGCALAALVVIVLIAYLIGRRRSRQKGYQSV